MYNQNTKKMPHLLVAHPLTRLASVFIRSLTLPWQSVGARDEREHCMSTLSTSLVRADHINLTPDMALNCSIDVS